MYLWKTVAVGVVVLAAIGIVCPAAVTASVGKSAARVRTGGTIGAAERARLRSIALRGAHLLGEAHPIDLEAVRTTYAKYRQRFGNPPLRERAQLNHAGSLYLIEMHGHFRAPTGRINGRTFSYDEIFVNAKTNARISGLVSNRRQPLAALGPVARL